MDTLHRLLADSPILRLFAVVGLGYIVGQIRIRGVGFGVAGVLFAGLAVGAWGGPELALPEIVTQVGLAIFIYTLGLQAGPGFFRTFRKDGTRLLLVTAVAVGSAAVLAALAARLLGISGATAVGLFCGGTTNTPALASVLEALRHEGRPDGDPALVAPAIGYSIAYPFGVLGVIVAIQLALRAFRIRIDEERQAYEKLHGIGELHVRELRVEKGAPDGAPLTAGWVMERSGVVLTRHRHGFLTRLVKPETVLSPGDAVLALGNDEALARAEVLVGPETEEHLELARTDIETRRILVSNPDVAGKRISDLHLETLGAVITRVRRGDVEVAGTPSTVLQLGDRVRVVVYVQSIRAVTQLLGDSIQTITESEFLPLAIGLAAGVLLGMVPFPLPGGASLRLGLAGGPLVVALLLGRLGRTGRFVWILPLEANITLRQFGLMLFLVGVGVRAGSSILEPLRAEGLPLLGAGAAVTLGSAAATLLVGRLLLRLNAVELLGVLAGVHTQPAALEVATRISRTDATSLAYASVHPIATILKIVVAQALLALLAG